MKNEANTNKSGPPWSKPAQSILGLTKMCETDELRELRKEITKGIPRAKPGVYFRTYVPLKDAEHLDLVIEWLYRNNMIETETKYAFTRCAILTLKKTVLDTITESAAQRSTERPKSE